jgi:hypothetical protein
VSLLRLLDAALAALVTETDPEDEVAMVALPSASATTTAATVVGAEEVTAILIAAAQGTSTTTHLFFFSSYYWQKVRLLIQSYEYDGFIQSYEFVLPPYSYD